MFNVTEDEENQLIFTFENLEPVCFGAFLLINRLTKKLLDKT